VLQAASSSSKSWQGLDPGPPTKFVREGYQAAGDVTTTGSDMARFMSALLNGGCLDGTCVLRPETFRQFTDLDMNRLHPDALGMGS
jgi:CubicO group peptidase (beta-lactamase class C family)